MTSPESDCSDDLQTSLQYIQMLEEERAFDKKTILAIDAEFEEYKREEGKKLRKVEDELRVMNERHSSSSQQQVVEWRHKYEEMQARFDLKEAEVLMHIEEKEGLKGALIVQRLTQALAEAAELKEQLATAEKKENARMFTTALTHRTRCGTLLEQIGAFKKENAALRSEREVLRGVLDLGQLMKEGQEEEEWWQWSTEEEMKERVAEIKQQLKRREESHRDAEASLHRQMTELLQKRQLEQEEREAELQEIISGLMMGVQEEERQKSNALATVTSLQQRIADLELAAAAERSQEII